MARLDQKCHLLRAAVLLFGFILCFIWLAIRVIFGMKNSRRPHCVGDDLISVSTNDNNHELTR
ncbi:MAG TPA: hypothetical protein VFO39_00145 [Candidatus Sulfotelmatobacter sp.]|nr:hypothetical protein [Candidatus Sulfotelmatobacter sp.]